MAARRQRYTELTLEHQREVAAEQRITELYTRSVEQLGSGRAPVRFGGGLHALERLAQDSPAQRQTIVDVPLIIRRTYGFTVPRPHWPPSYSPADP